MFTTKNKSLLKGKAVCGGKYEVKRLPFGQFMEGIIALEDDLPRVITQLFPDKNVLEILNGVKAYDVQSIITLLFQAGKQAVSMLVKLTSAFSCIPVEQLMEDGDIGVNGITEIIIAAIEVNGIADFFTKGLPELKKVWQATKQTS